VLVLVLCCLLVCAKPVADDCTTTTTTGQYHSTRGYHYAPGTAEVLSQTSEPVGLQQVEVVAGADIMEL